MESNTPAANFNPSNLITEHLKVNRLKFRHQIKTNYFMKGFSYMVFISEIVLQVKIAEQAEKRLPIDPGNFNQIEVWC